ncbi:MAG: PDZ domain-containing protein [Gemmatimonadetes bacterium]|nr:PDZ domain-containing protein [Gemmatimonadota bacterium]
MKTIGWSSSAVAGALLLGATTAMTPVGMSAQQRAPRAERTDCRCVDSAGKEIPDCTCFRTISPGNLMVTALGRPAARARLGVTVSATQEAADDAKGAKVQSVLEDGPAAEAGIREGDIITRVDGKSLFDPLDPSVEKGFDLNESIPVQRLLAISRELEPDTKVDVEYLRDGKSETAVIRTRDLDSWTVMSNMPGFPTAIFRTRMDSLRNSLDSLARSGRRWRVMVPEEGRRLRLFTDSAGSPDFYLETPGGGTYHLWGPDTTGIRSWRCPGETGSGFGGLVLNNECIGGLRLIQLNPGLGSYFDTDKGVLVSDVDPGSTTGLQPGDVILEIGGREVSSPDKARRILASYSASEDIQFRIVRKGKTMEVQGRLGR